MFGGLPNAVRDGVSKCAFHGGVSLDGEWGRECAHVFGQVGIRVADSPLDPST